MPDKGIIKLFNDHNYLLSIH